MPEDAPTRPPTVPEGAAWSPPDNEWILGDRDDAGRLVGLVRYWRPDGTLVCACPHRAGKPHGDAVRFHESGEVSQRCTYEDGVLHGVRVWLASDAPTTERMHALGMGPAIRRVEIDYVHGVARAFRYFLADGTEVARDGDPLPPRPAGVPSSALWSPRPRAWIDGGWDDRGEPVGEAAVYDRDGVLLHRQRYVHGRTEGPWTYFEPDGRARLQLHYRDGVLEGPALVHDASGTLLRRAEIAGGRTRWFEDLDPAGAVVRRVELLTAKSPSIEPPSGLDDDERTWVAMLDDEETALEAADHLQSRDLSPAARSIALAIGWGGDEERPRLPARAARRLLRETASPSLSAALQTLGLDRAPRVFTASRLAAVVDRLATEPTLDADTLRQGLSERGGPGRVLALEAGGSAALAALENARVGDNLRLSAIGLRRLPDALGQLAELRRLDLSRNNLHALPEALGGLILLGALDLTGNRIEALPASLAGLSELRTLHLADNDLTALPPGLTALRRLRALGLGGNRLRALSPDIAALESLDTLWLERNDLESLPLELARLPRLRFLHLGDHAFAEPPAVIFELPAIEELWLASRSLERLPAAIADLPRLRRLMVWYSSLREVPDALFEMRQLRELRITHNPLPKGTIERLREALPDTTIS